MGNKVGCGDIEGRNGIWEVDLVYGSLVGSEKRGRNSPFGRSLVYEAGPVNS